MKPFAEWTYQDAVTAIGDRKKERLGDDAYAANHAIVEKNDLWQDGKTWVGPRGTESQWAVAQKRAVERQHVPGAASIEALSNFARGLFGKEANIQIVPRGPIAEGSEAEEQAKKDAEELVGLLSAWWDRVGLWRLVREAGVRSRWATWGTLRSWIPPGRLVRQEGADPRLPTLDSFEDALGAIELTAPEPDHCIVLTHPESQDRAAIFHYSVEVSGRPQKRVELWYQAGEQTALRILPENDAPQGPYEYDWDGTLPVAEMEGELLITEPVRRQEAALSFAETNVVKVGETAGFRERYTINAEPHGLWLSTPPVGAPIRSTADGKGGLLYFHPMPRPLGPSVTSDLYGVKIKDADGKETRATPSVTFADPVNPEYATKTAEYRRSRVLQLCGQGHLAMYGRGESSGFAYEQSRAAFRGDLEWHKSPAEMAIMQLIEAVVRIADSMTSEPKRWMERYRLVVTLTVDPGPVSPEMTSEVRDLVKDRLLSRASAMSRLGVEDVAAELEAIAQEPGAMFSMLKQQMELVQLLVGEGVPWERAAKIARIEDKEILALLRAQDAEQRAGPAQEGAQDDEIDDVLNAPVEGAAA